MIGNRMATMLEEKDAIRETIARYCYLVDSARFDEWGDLFTEDGEFDVEGVGRFQGRATIVGFMKKIPLNAKGLPGFKHCTQNQVIQVEGDAATAECYLLLVREGDPLRVDIAGRYEDTLVKRGGRWLFRKRVARFDFSSMPGR